MTEGMNQAGQAPAPEELQGAPAPEGEQISLSADELEGLGDLSDLQNQELNLEGNSISAEGEGPMDPSNQPVLVSKGNNEVKQAENGLASSNTGLKPQEPADIQSATFQPLTISGSAGSDVSGIEILMDVPLKVTVELGRTNMMVRDVLNLQSGSVVELERMAGDVVDILINERLMAKGEVVVVDDKFGVRITEVMGNPEKGSIVP